MPTLARAGAFLQPPGEGQVIATFRFTHSAQVFDANGRPKRNSFYTKSEVQAYAEYGIAEWVTLVFSPSIEHLHVQNAAPPSYTGTGNSEAAARVRLLNHGPLVVSAQGGLVSRGDWLGYGHRGLTGKPGLQADARLLAGAGFECGPWACFAEAQVGWRSRAVQAAAEWRGDMTFGVRPVASVLVLVQSFTAILAKGARQGGQTHKLQVSAVYEWSKSVSLQAGMFVTVLGRNAPLERGLLTAMWYRF